jgi:hypothetical protein
LKAWISIVRLCVFSWIGGGGGRSLIWCFVGKVAGAYVYVSIDTHFVAYCSDSFAIEAKVVGKYVLAVMFAGAQVCLRT